MSARTQTGTYSWRYAVLCAYVVMTIATHYFLIGWPAFSYGAHGDNILSFSRRQFSALPSVLHRFTHMMIVRRFSFRTSSRTDYRARDTRAKIGFYCAHGPRRWYFIEKHTQSSWLLLSVLAKQRKKSSIHSFNANIIIFILTSFVC